MSRFDFDITYVKGEYNKVADCLSRYYESDTAADVHGYHDYVQADLRIDPTGDNLPATRYEEVVEKVVEIHAMHAMEARRSRCLQEARDRLEVEVQDLAPPPTRKKQLPSQHEPIPQPTTKGRKPENELGTQQSMTLGNSLRDETSGEAPASSKHLETDKAMIEFIKNGYPTDPQLFKIILDKPEQYTKSFAIRDGLIWTINNKGSKVICLPGDRELITKVLMQAHKIVGHFRGRRTCEYIRR